MDNFIAYFFHVQGFSIKFNSNSIIVIFLTSLGQEPLTGINDFTKMKKIEREE